jgi:hypothetical protein
MKLRHGVPAIACLSLGGLAVACSKGDSRATSTSTRVLPGSFPTPPALEGTTATPPDTASARGSREPLDYDGAPLTYIVTETLEGSVVKVDPDQDVVKAARIAGAGCFYGLQGGPEVRSAFIRVFVVPSGSVSRTEVGGASEPAVLDCLRRVGDNLHFSAQDESRNKDSQTESIRSFSIDVSVARAH